MVKSSSLINSYHSHPYMTFVLVGSQILSILCLLLGKDETLLEQKHLSLFGTQLG